MRKMVETDSNRDVRPGAKQFISDKSFKERVKKLSAFSRENWRNGEKSEMACALGDREESPSLSVAPSENFKLNRKKFLYVCNGVEHVSVPRKLRSAMKKLNGESSSSPYTDSKKLNYSGGGIKSPKKVGVKRSKQNQKQGGPNRSLQQSIGPITKDEEEVVETLYALAGMFPDIETDNRIKTDSYAQELQAPEEDQNAHCLNQTDDAINLASDMERLPEINTNDGPSIHVVANFSSKEESPKLDRPIAHGTLNKMLDMQKEKKPINFCFQLESYQDNGKVMQSAKAETSILETKPDIELGMTTTFGQRSQPRMTHESEKNASWTGFSSSHGPQLQSCAAKVPAWFGAKPISLQNDSSTGIRIRGRPKVQTDQRTRKKCASHIYISRLIKSLQMPESEESLELVPNKLKPQEILKQGAHVTTNHFSSITHYLNAVASPSSQDENLNDTKSGNLQHLRNQQDNPQKQSFNFLSLSAGGGEIGYNRAANRPESMAALQIPCQAQNPTSNLFSTYQTQGISGYPQMPQAKLPDFSSSRPPQVSHNTLQLWASQLGEYRNTRTSAPSMHFPSLQCSRSQGLAAMIPCMASSAPNVEVLGPTYPPYISHLQHQQYVGLSLQHGRLKRQPYHLSSVHEESEVGFRGDGSALPMQLPCNDHL